jgi:hypothetical protein
VPIIAVSQMKSPSTKTYRFRLVGPMLKCVTSVPIQRILFDKSQAATAAQEHPRESVWLREQPTVRTPHHDFNDALWEVQLGECHALSSPTQQLINISTPPSKASAKEHARTLPTTEFAAKRHWSQAEDKMLVKLHAKFGNKRADLILQERWTMAALASSI